MLLCWEIHKLLKGSTSHFGGEAFFKHFRNLCKIICASSWKHGIIIKASWSLPISSIVCVVSQMWRANTFWRDSKGSKHISLKGWNLLPKIGYMSQQCYAICRKVVSTIWISFTIHVSKLLFVLQMWNSLATFCSKPNLVEGILLFVKANFTR